VPAQVEQSQVGRAGAEALDGEVDDASGQRFRVVAVGDVQPLDEVRPVPLETGQEDGAVVLRLVGQPDSGALPDGLRQVYGKTMQLVLPWSFGS
jgi:hypothetical protein